MAKNSCVAKVNFQFLITLNIRALTSESADIVLEKS